MPELDVRNRRNRDPVLNPKSSAVDQPTNGVKPAQILDAIKNPLKVAAPKTDSLGRVSQKLVGEKASVVVNPKSGEVITVHPTSTKTAEKLMEANK